MTFLAERIAGASGDEVSVATLLRKVKVVASRLGHLNLEEWVDHELTGYPLEATLPDYRANRPATVLGDFSGPFGSGMQNVPIPPVAFPADYREGPLFTLSYTEPIAQLEQLARSEDSVRAMWPADAVALTNHMTNRGEWTLIEGMGLVQAWKPIMPVTLSAVVDTVRTRILDLALSLERLVPDAGQPDAVADDAASLERLVMNIYGGNVAVQSSHFTQEVTMPSVGDEEALFSALEAAGVSAEDQDALRQAMSADEATGEGAPRTAIGSRVRQWAGTFGMKAASNAGKGAAATGGGLALKAIASFYGVEFG